MWTRPLRSNQLGSLLLHHHFCADARVIRLAILETRLKQHILEPASVPTNADAYRIERDEHARDHVDAPPHHPSEQPFMESREKKINTYWERRRQYNRESREKKPILEAREKKKPMLAKKPKRLRTRPPRRGKYALPWKSILPSAGPSPSNPGMKATSPGLPVNPEIRSTSPRRVRDKVKALSLRQRLIAASNAQTPPIRILPPPNEIPFRRPPVFDKPSSQFPSSQLRSMDSLKDRLKRMTEKKAEIGNHGFPVAAIPEGNDQIFDINSDDLYLRSGNKNEQQVTVRKQSDVDQEKLEKVALKVGTLLEELGYWTSSKVTRSRNKRRFFGPHGLVDTGALSLFCHDNGFGSVNFSSEELAFGSTMKQISAFEKKGGSFLPNKNTHKPLVITDSAGKIRSIQIVPISQHMIVDVMTRLHYMELTGFAGVGEGISSFYNRNRKQLPKHCIHPDRKACLQSQLEFMDKKLFNDGLNQRWILPGNFEKLEDWLVKLGFLDESHRQSKPDIYSAMVVALRAKQIDPPWNFSAATDSFFSAYEARALKQVSN